MATTLLLAVGFVRFWPASPTFLQDPLFVPARDGEVIQLETVQPTRQRMARAAPPAPPVPIALPDETVLDDAELDFSDGLLSFDDGAQDRGMDDLDADAGPTGGPTLGPRTLRFVEPEYTQEARKRRVRAEVVVRVLVNDQGEVEEATIVERFLLDGSGSEKRPVETVGYGLEEAALSAADRWMFQPARRNGEAVPSHAMLTFTFGLDS